MLNSGKLFIFIIESSNYKRKAEGGARGNFAYGRVALRNPARLFSKIVYKFPDNIDINNCKKWGSNPRIIDNGS